MRDFADLDLTVTISSCGTGRESLLAYIDRQSCHTPSSMVKCLPLFGSTKVEDLLVANPSQDLVAMKMQLTAALAEYQRINPQTPGKPDEPVQEMTAILAAIDLASTP